MPPIERWPGYERNSDRKKRLAKGADPTGGAHARLQPNTRSGSSALGINAVFCRCCRDRARSRGMRGHGRTTPSFQRKAGARSRCRQSSVGPATSGIPIGRNDWLKEQIRPAVPTLDSSQILDLVRLRLESMQFSAGVAEIVLEAEACAATVEQLRLFSERPARDLDAANRALARLRAEFRSEETIG